MKYKFLKHKFLKTQIPQNTNSSKKCCTLGTMLHIGGLHIGCTRCNTWIMQHEFKICHDWWIIISVTDWNCWFGQSILDLMNKNCIFLIDWMDPLVWMKTQLLMQPKCAPSIPRRLWRHNIFYKIPFALNQTHYLSRTAPILDPLKSNRIWRHVSHIFALMNDLHSRNQYSKKREICLWAIFSFSDKMA